MIAQIKNLLLTLPDLHDWPAMTEAFDRAGAKPRLDWELPILANRAVGGPPEAGMAAAAAIACLQISIILVDDLLDEDPRGEHRRIGPGQAANLALAFQAAASQLIARGPVEEARQAAAQRCLADAAVQTAFGQQLDVQNLDGEAHYWRLVQSKSSPFYSAALELGAIIGGANPATAQGLRRLGALIGEIVQLNDDILDAFQTPANPDWLQGRTNLLILYGRTAPHREQEAFQRALGSITSPQALAEAQQILIRSGAVSYAVYHITQRVSQAQEIMAGLALADPGALADQLKPIPPSLAEMLRSHGVQIINKLVKSPQDGNMA